MTAYSVRFRHNPAYLGIVLRGKRYDFSHLLPRGYTLVAGAGFFYTESLKQITYDVNLSRYPGIDVYLLSFLHELGHAHTLRKFKRHRLLCRLGWRKAHPKVWWERAAWAYALRTLRDLERWGLPVLATASDLRTVVKHCLCTYESIYVDKTGQRAGFAHGEIHMDTVPRIQKLKVL